MYSAEKLNIQEEIQMKKLSLLIGAFFLLIIAAGCSTAATSSKGEESVMDSEITYSKQDIAAIAQQSENDNENTEINTSPELVYFGHASMMIHTENNKVIYVDPFADGDYSYAADLILVTHDHYDHNQLDKIKNRNDGCKIITQNEALQNGEYQSFELPFVTVKAVEAGNNPNHDINSCVGYVLTFNNGKKVYISGDTSTTDQMSKLSDMNIDYAFFCCDGVYNMDIEEAAKCAKAVGAKHNIPYHNEPATGELLDKELAQKFDAPNKKIVLPGESITIE